MTNVPTLYDLIILFLILTFIPFWTAFVISYVTYRRLGIGFLGGLAGVISLVPIMYLVDSALWMRGIIAGIFGGTVLTLALSRYYKPQTPKIRVDNRTIVSLLLITGLILSSILYYSSEKADLEFCIDDPSGDVSYSGYTEPELSGHDNLDILRLESRIAGDSVILEMELAGEINESSAAEYTCYIATQEQNLWTNIIDIKNMEKEGNILRTKIPVESLKERKIFQVLVVASEFDASHDLDLYDNCSNMGDFWGFLKILTS